MRIKKIFLSLAIATVVGFMILQPLSAQGRRERIPLTTYYPAAIAVFDELRIERAAIGPTYSDPTQYCWAPDVCPNQISADTVLIVEGDTGIGTHAPDGRLEVDYNGSNGSATLVLDDSTDPSTDPWDNSISFQKQGTELTRLGIDGTHDSSIDTTTFDGFGIDISNTTHEPDFRINPEGSVSVGSLTGDLTPDKDGDGYLNVNDIYLESQGQWLSDLLGGGGSGGGSFTVYKFNGNGNDALRMANPVVLVGDIVHSGDTARFSWNNTPFSQAPDVVIASQPAYLFGTAPDSAGIDQGVILDPISDAFINGSTMYMHFLKPLDSSTIAWMLSSRINLINRFPEQPNSEYAPQGPLRLLLFMIGEGQVADEGD